MRKLFILCYLLTSISLFGQNYDPEVFLVFGKVFEEHQNTPLEFATITFTKQSSKEVFRVISDSKGRFEIELDSADYSIVVSYISFLDAEITISNLKKDTDLGSIILKTDVKTLEEITVQGNKDQVVLKPNTLVYNVSKDVSSDGASASDILGNIPTLDADENGSILFRGNINATILVNGKTSLIDVNLLPASSIDYVEVISNPGASYRASDLAIVNIILKKGKDQGFTSSITASGGYKEDYGVLLNLSNKTRRTNIYTNISYFNRLRAKVGDFKTTFFDNGTPESFMYETSFGEEYSQVFYGNIGIDFYISDYMTIGGSMNYSKIDTDGDLKGNTEWFDANNTLLEINKRNNERFFDNEILEYFFDLESNFKNGNALTFNFEFKKDAERYENEFENSNPNFEEPDFVEYNKLKNARARLKYQSNSDHGTFTAGYEGDFGIIPFSYKTNSDQIKIDYTEYVNALYAEYEWETSKMYYGLGLRTEFTNTEIDYKTENSTTDKVYENFFPTAFIERYLTDNKSLSLSYNRGIIRPSYKDLQPFEHKFSESSSYRGNVDLNPVYADMINLTYAYYGDKVNIVPTLFFNKYDDYMQIVTTEEAGPTGTKFINSPQNIGYLTYYGLSAVITYDATKWLDFTLNTNIFEMHQEGTYTYVSGENETITLDYGNKNVSGTFGLLTKINFSEKLSLQSKVQHHLKSVGGQSVRKARTWANLSLAQELFQGNGTLSFTASDLFNTFNTIERDRFDDNYYLDGLIENDFQTFILSFTYRFNQSEKNRKIDFSKKEEIEKYIP